MPGNVKNNVSNKIKRDEHLSNDSEDYLEVITLISELKKVSNIEFPHISRLFNKKIKPSNPLWVISFYLSLYELNNLSSLEYEFKEKFSNQIKKIWNNFQKRFPINKSNYSTEEFWINYLHEEKVYTELKKLFELLLQTQQELDWIEFNEILNTFFINLIPPMNEQQFKTLITILENQTESNQVLHLKTKRSIQSISRDKKYLYDNKILNRSLWINFNRIGLYQKEVLVIYNSLTNNIVKLINCPWLFSYSQSTIIQNYQLFSFLLPQNQTAINGFNTFVEHIINTTDASEVLIITPDFETKPLFVSFNYSFYNPEKGNWNIPIGFPILYSKAKKINDNAKILTSERVLMRKDLEKLFLTKDEIKALSTFYIKGVLSIRELSEHMGISFHKSRKILEKITRAILYKERFTSRIGSTLSNVYLLAVDHEDNIEKLKIFGTYFPEQYMSSVEIKKHSLQKNKWETFYGAQIYLRTIPHYLEETILAINRLVNRNKILTLPILGARQTNWKIPSQRWDDEKQEWIVKKNDFIII